MNEPDKLKDASRGYGRDMSPAAISRRLDIVVELNETCEWLGKAQLVESEATTHVSKPNPAATPDASEMNPGIVKQEQTERTERKPSVSDSSVPSCRKTD